MKRYAFEMTRVIVHHVEAENETMARARLLADILGGETDCAFDRAETETVLLDIEDAP